MSNTTPEPYTSDELIRKLGPLDPREPIGRKGFFAGLCFCFAGMIVSFLIITPTLYPNWLDVEDMTDLPTYLPLLITWTIPQILLMYRRIKSTGRKDRWVDALLFFGFMAFITRSADRALIWMLIQKVYNWGLMLYLLFAPPKRQVHG